MKIVRSGPHHHDSDSDHDQTQTRNLERDQEVQDRVVLVPVELLNLLLLLRPK